MNSKTLTLNDMKNGMNGVKNNAEPKDLDYNLSLELDLPESKYYQTIGYKMASQLHASLEGLKNAMLQIMSEYLAELKGTETPRHQNLKNQLAAYDETIIQKQHGIDTEKNKHQELKREIEEHKNNAEKTKVDSESDFLTNEFSWVKVILLTFFSVILGISITFFYAALFNNAIFSNMAERITHMNSESLDIFNSIIDDNLLFQLNYSTVLSYFFSSLVLVLGLLLHYNHSTNKWINILQKVFMLGLAFTLELVLAYNIENNIYDLKVMTGFVDEKPGFWGLILSKEVMLVLLMGFAAYIIWSLALETTVKEWQKRNPRKMAAIKIAELSKQINRKTQQLSVVNKEILDYENEIKILDSKKEQLFDKLNHIYYNENELKRRLNEFFGGWLRYIHTIKNHSITPIEQQEAFDKFKSQMINSSQIA